MSKSNSRAEVEARLEAAQASINSRLTSLEGEVRVPRIASIQDVSSVDLKKVGIAVTSGLLVAWGLSKLFRSRGGGDDYAEDLAQDVDRFVDDGYELDAAVRRAVRRNASSAAPPDRSSGGIWAALVMLVARSSVNALVRSLFDRSFGAANAPESEQDAV